MAAILIDGYHFGVDDGAIYIPAIKKAYDPRLYPYGAEFFLSHARLSLFGAVVARSARWMRLSIESAVLVWHLACLVLLLAAAWQIACILFSKGQARWGAVALLAAALPVPVAGTALYLWDTYFSARSVSTPLALLAVGFFLRGRVWPAFLSLLLSALFHPQMALYCAALLLILWWNDRRAEIRGRVLISKEKALLQRVLNLLLLVPERSWGGFSLHPVVGVYRDVLHSRTYFFAWGWRWYEWIGALTPLLLLGACTYLPAGTASPALRKTSRSLVVMGIVAAVAFLVISSSPHFESLARLQPMRAFHLIYLLLFLMLGGLLGEFVLQRKFLHWAALLLPLAIGMYGVDRSQYSASVHVEWPWQTPSNPWLQAFAWVRGNTPVDAVFALDPSYLAITGEDTHGFRALAERSALADFVKDSGAVTMFPALLPEWESQQRMEHGWRTFDAADFERLSRISPVRWVIVQHTQENGLSCPYSNAGVAVCRVGVASSSPSTW